MCARVRACTNTHIAAGSVEEQLKHVMRMLQEEGGAEAQVAATLRSLVPGLFYSVLGLFYLVSFTRHEVSFTAY